MTIDWTDIDTRQPGKRKPPPAKKLKPVKTGVYFYVPETFDAGNFPALDGLHNEAHWLISEVIQTSHAYRHAYGEARFGVPVSQQTMRQFIDPAYQKLVKDTLVGAGVLDQDAKAVKIARFNNGVGRATEYRLNEAYNGPLTRVECDKRSLANKVMAHRVRLGDGKVGAAVRKLRDYLKSMLVRVKIDAGRAYRIIEQTGAMAPKRKAKKARKKIANQLTHYAMSTEMAKSS